VSFALSGNGTLLSLGGTTNGNGQVTTTFRSSELGFPAIVTATYGSISGTVTIDQPTVAQVKLISMQWTVMGARFSTFQETNVLRFQVLDSLNVPYPRDLRVDFTHESKGKSFLGDTPSCDAATNVCSASAITDAQGFVTVTLRSGTIASPVAVLATATGGGASVQGDASQIAVVGAKASGAHLSLICTPQNVPGYAAHDCINSEYGGADNSITCTVALGDRFNNLLGKATLATFASEAGATGPPATTPAYDPSKTQTNLGRTTGYVAVTGYKLPVDVLPLDAAPPLDPATREYRLSYDDGMGCGTRIHNPRDGLSTIIVQVNGEEGFVDGNGNGTYDAGENFIDMAEPFVDADDSGDRTGTESFVDVNDNGRWDPPNREWDADTVIWAETRVLYSGLVTTHFIAPDHQISRFAATHVGLPAPTPTQPFQVWVKTDTSPAQGTSVYAYFADANFNPPTPRTSYALSTVGLVTAKWMTTPPTPGYSTGVGLSQLYCSTPTPTNISTECDAVSCNYAPCYVVTNIGAFNYGTGAYVRLDPKADPDPGAGLNATATFNGLGTSISVNGSSSVPSP
jgi:hypothetical protein